MDAPIKEWQQLKDLQRQGRELLAADRLAEALAVAEAALAVEVSNIASLVLKADVLERQGQTNEAAPLRDHIRRLRREAWQREVEAEIRGHHDLLGEAIRHEQP